MTRASFLFALLCACTIPLGHVAAQVPEADRALVVFGTDTIRAEVARTPEERERGLMFRNDVPEGTGMLFVFDRPSIQSIWMKDTHVPLDVAFIDTSFRIVDIQALEPLDLTVKSSSGPAQFALEVRQGWFAAHGIEHGDQARIEMR
jgi:uncharacterized membrane protein (UPF0127 family)